MVSVMSMKRQTDFVQGWTKKLAPPLPLHFLVIISSYISSYETSDVSLDNPNKWQSYTTMSMFRKLAFVRTYHQIDLFALFLTKTNYLVFTVLLLIGENRQQAVLRL